MAESVHDPDCIFCKIVQGTISSARVLETDQAVAFLDINPINPGHVLLVPRTHHAHLGELPEEVAARVGSLLPRLFRAVAAATGAEGFNVIMNNGRVAGQTICHGHWHIIPRFEGVRMAGHANPTKSDIPALQELAKQIAAAIEV